MKTQLLLTVAGLAFGFALPTFAQQKDTVDPQIIEQLAALGTKTDEAFNDADAVALAALYTDDAVLVMDVGPIYGREAIEKHFSRLFQHIHFTNHMSKADQYSPHTIGTAGNAVWSNGEWTATVQGHGFGQVVQKGYWASIAVRAGDTWKTRFAISNWNVIPGTPGNH